MAESTDPAARAFAEALGASYSLNLREADRARCVSALERLLHNFEALLAQKPVRDAEETIAEAEAALAKARGEP